MVGCWGRNPDDPIMSEIFAGFDAITDAVTRL